jgi:CDP-diglyceride synthetase
VSDEPPLSSALPSRGARFLAFAAILLGGLCGGLIGFSVTRLQCVGDCSTNKSIGGLVGAVLGAAGVAVISVLALRAMGEWKTIQDQEPRRRDSRRKPSA